jgi:hypothetical protein
MVCFIVYNTHKFLLCYSERGTVVFEEKKCNMATTVFANCIRAMVEIVSKYFDLYVAYFFVFIIR